MIDVTILTEERYVFPKVKDEYINNVLLEDDIVLNALKKLGLKTQKIAWSDESYDWRQTKMAMFRTTWDYAERFDEFSVWLKKVALETTLINDVATINWNLDKHYLKDLKKSHVNIIETYFMEPGETRSLREIHDAIGWGKTVLKPAISAAAKDTFKLDQSNLHEYEARFSELIKKESMLLQPFQNSIVERGEVSLMVMNGEFTHAVLKKAKLGDFRVQDDFGGSVHEYSPNESEIALALKAVNACRIMPLYARVDIVNDNNGIPAISELELVEPELWFRRNEDAAMKLAIGLKELLTS